LVHVHCLRQSQVGPIGAPALCTRILMLTYLYCAIPNVSFVWGLDVQAVCNWALRVGRHPGAEVADCMSRV
jgi:hypothetical protein